MKVSEALRERHATRAFVDRDVDINEIKRMLRLASHAPSGANTQPWRVAVVSGQVKLTLERKFLAEYRSGNTGKPDYDYYPVQWTEPYKSRRFACGMQLYSAVGIKRKDKQRRIDQWVENYRAFGAPVMLFFYMESHLEAGSYMDFGMFLQSLMLIALEEGLATCPQAALGEYPEIVKKELGLPKNTVLLCGMAVGYEDTDAAVNQYRTPRAELDEFVTFHR
ncbi:MAG: nitroreductase [Arenicellales bacterium]|nr:nitroreductase [Arenicellales bacterium]